MHCWEESGIFPSADSSGTFDHAAMNTGETFETEEQRFQCYGQMIYDVIHPRYPGLAGKFTGMLMDMHYEDLVRLIHDQDELWDRVGEALIVLTDVSSSEESPVEECPVAPMRQSLFRLQHVDSRSFDEVHRDAVNDFLDGGAHSSSDESENVGISYYPMRAGAGASAATSRKRELAKLLTNLRQWIDAGDDDEDEAELTQCLSEVAKELENFANKKKPRRADAIKTLEKALLKLGVKGDLPEQKPQTATERRQTFYGLFSGKVDESKPGKKTKKKAAKETATEQFPRFDLSQKFARLEIIAANALLKVLERAEMPTAKVCVCKDEAQVLEFKEMYMAFAQGKENSLSLITKHEGKVEVPHSKQMWLPWHGNIALVKAVVARIDAKTVELQGEEPTQVKAALESRSLVTLRTFLPWPRGNPHPLLGSFQTPDRAELLALVIAFCRSGCRSHSYLFPQATSDWSFLSWSRAHPWAMLWTQLGL